MSTLYQKYLNEIRPNLQKELGCKSVMAVPKIVKVTLNMGLGKAIRDKKIIDDAMEEMALISGQKPVSTLARRSNASFKIREGYPIGCKVSLRRVYMYEFIDRLVSIAIPRIRDFRGLNPKSFDGYGNFSMGITEQIIFPEIDYDKIKEIRGMNIVVTTSTNNDKDALALLKAFNFPFKK